MRLISKKTNNEFIHCFNTNSYWLLDLDMNIKQDGLQYHIDDNVSEMVEALIFHCNHWLSKSDNESENNSELQNWFSESFPSLSVMLNPEDLILEYDSTTITGSLDPDFATAKYNRKKRVYETSGDEIYYYEVTKQEIEAYKKHQKALQKLDEDEYNDDDNLFDDDTNFYISDVDYDLLQTELIKIIDSLNETYKRLGRQQIKIHN